MINGLHTSALAAYGQNTRLGIISNNLANVDTPGFRKESLTFGERLVEAQEGFQDYVHYNSYVDRYGGAPFIDSMHFDRTPGVIEQTERPLDFALDGEGFFGVVDPATETVHYTRAGNFTINAEGYLVTADGRYRVLNRGNEPIQLALEGTSEIRVGRDGSLALFRNEPGVAPVEAGNIGVFQVPVSQLTKFGDTLLRNLGGEGVPVENPTVQQGYLESSSVDPVREMVDMIATMRIAEANMSMIRFQDATLDRAINNLGRLG